MSAHARIDTCGLLVVVVVEDVRGSEAEQWTAGFDLVEVVVRIGDAEVTSVLGSVLIGVTD